MAKRAKLLPTKKIKGFSWATADVYKQTVFLSIGQSDKELKKSLLKYVSNITETQANEVVDYVKRKYPRHSGVFATAEGLYIIRLFDEGDLYNQHFHSILAHETLHATFELLRSRGLTYSYDSEEAYTYLHDLFIAEFYESLLK